MRAARIGIGNDECLIYPETLLENRGAQIAEHRPDLVVIDSIQTIYTDLLDSSAGSVSQIRECAATLLKYAKSTGTSIFIIGHITKDGSIAGPKILEHIVDVVLQSRATATTSTASCGASRTGSERRSKSGSSRCSTPDCGGLTIRRKSC